MPSLIGTPPNVQVPPWWSTMRPQTPSKPSASAEQLHRHDHADEKRSQFPIQQYSVPDRKDSMNKSREDESHRGVNGSVPELAPLQEHSGLDGLDPVVEDNPASYDLLAPTEAEHRKEYSLEKRAQSLLSREHLQIIFGDPSLLFRFTAFLTSQRPHSLPMLVYYLDCLKAMRAIHYANAISQGLEPVRGQTFTSEPVTVTANAELEKRANSAFDILAREDLPAYITSQYIQIVSLSITRRITGSLSPRLREASEGLAEVFCLTDPSRPDNPIVFASEGEKDLACLARAVC